MAQITINYPDQNAIDIRDTLCAAWGYQDTIDGEPNPESKVTFIKKRVAKFVSQVYVDAKGLAAAVSADASARQSASGVLID